MASALQLNCTSTVYNGSGLSSSPALAAEISAFQNLKTVSTIQTIFTNANGAEGNLNALLMPVLANIGTGVTKAQFLIDFYPSNVTPTCSTNTVTYGLLANVYIVPLTGEVVTTYDPVPSTTSFSKTIKAQADLPFNHGVAGFGNVFSTCYGHASEVFDTVSSVHILQDRSFKESGLGYKNNSDLATNGLGNSSPILGSTVASWGTMYDINNISTFSDPYVFGQNLLNQGLGGYGDLAKQLTAVGLDITDLTKIPTKSTVTTQTTGNITSSTPVGAVDFPITSTITTTIDVSGSSSDVVLKIYRSITGSNLSAIISATGFSSNSVSNLTSLADFLDYNKAIEPDDKNSLSTLGIHTFSNLSTYLHSRLGNAIFISWKALSDFLIGIDIPEQKYASVTTAADPVLSPTTITTLNTITGTGSGPFANPIMSDYLGAVAGIPYTDMFKTLIVKYGVIGVADLETKLTALLTAVNNYIATGAIPDGLGGYTYSSPTAVITAVNNVNNSLNAISNNPAYQTAVSEYYNALSRMPIEVEHLVKAGINFTPPTNSAKYQFASSLPELASDQDKLETRQLINNVISNDASGDIIRAAISENINNKKLMSVNITSTNDPKPEMTLLQAQAQNVPLSTYLSQNK